MMRKSPSVGCHVSPRSGRWLSLLLLLAVSMVCPGQEQTRRETTRTRTPRSNRLKTVQLPAPASSSAVSIERALTLSQDLALPSDQKLTLAEIGQLVWAAQGVSVQQIDDETTTPTNLVPVKIYLSMADGVYLYEPQSHTLQQRLNQDVRAAVSNAVFNRQRSSTAPTMPTLGGCQIVISGSARDFSGTYGQRARNVMLLLTGQMSQNIQLQAVSLDLTYVASGDMDGSAVKRALRLARTDEPLYVAFVGHPASSAEDTTEQQPQQQVYKRAVIIVPPSGFQDQELGETIRTLGLASVQTVIASTRAGQLVGSFGNTAQADMPLNQVKVEDFDAFVFIGGLGTIEYYNNPLAVGLARQAVAQQKVVAASSTAPVILANAGVLRGVRATCLPAERNQLVAAGAVFTGTGVQRDGLIITSTGPMVVPLFAGTIVEALAGN